MFDKNLLVELVDKCLNDISTSSNLSPGSLKEELLTTIRAVLHKTFTELDLVTREQFDIQTKVLAQAKQKLELLENKIIQLENLK